MIAAPQSLEALTEQLATLRQQLETRQTQLVDLHRRKETLESQLREVEGEIAAVNEGRQTPSAGKAASAPASTRSSGFTSHKASTTTAHHEKTSLSQLLVELVRQADRPLTVKELTQEVQRRNYPTASKNLHGLIQTRVQELVRQQQLRRRKGQPGVRLGRAATAAAPLPTPVSEEGQPTTRSGRPSTQSQPSLKELLTGLLARSERPRRGRELAEEALAAGYQTSSKNFVSVVSVQLTNMPQLEHVPGQGYRLRKRAR